MQPRRPMRLLLREYGSCGGIETVNIHLIREFTRLVERVVWIMPGWRMNFFQKIFPPSERLIYQLPYWPREARLAQILHKATSLALRQKKLPARAVFDNMFQAQTDLWLRRLIRQHAITHCFCNWTFRVGVPRVGIPIGAMVMDVRWKRFPETFPQLDVKAVDRQFGDWLRKSSVIFPVSETTAADISRFFPDRVCRTQIVPHGAEIVSHNGEHASLPGGGRRLFFCPAAANGHKNHITLFRACTDLFNKGFDFNVVLTGLQTNYFDQNQPIDQCPPNGEAAVEEARLFLRQHEHLFQGRIKALGYVDRPEIERLYRGCSAVVLPSSFEGFGLPLVEALQNGAKVICSDIEAHREQLRRYDCIDQVAIVPPFDAAALAAEMEKILHNPAGGALVRPEPPDTLTRWTWRDAAEAYLDSLAAVTSTHDDR